MSGISPLAVVAEGAHLADDVRVGPFSYVGPQVRLGPGCVIENNVTLTGKTQLGANNHVSPMAVVGAHPVDDEGRQYTISGECVIGEANAIREHTVIYGGRDGPTRIGSDNLIMVGCQIGQGASIGDHEAFANWTSILAGAVIEDYVRTSAFPVVQENVRVGAYTFIGGYTRVDRDAPPFAMIQGQPFRVRGVNTHNLRRCGFEQADIRALKRAFRDLYNGAGRGIDRDVLERLLGDPESPPPVLRLARAVAQGLESNGDRHD